MSILTYFLGAYVVGFTSFYILVQVKSFSSKLI